MDMEEKGTQVCDQTGDTAPDAGEQEDFEALIRGHGYGREGDTGL
nr:MAG TPA: hypothetical protein [Bacteriophage sp.]